MKALVPFALVPAALGFALTAAPAQDPPPRQTKVVLRISRTFLAELTGRTFVRDQPIETTALGATVTGAAHLDGRFNVKLHKSDTESAFDLLLNGEVRTLTAATRRPVVVHTHGSAPFHARCRIDFDGKTFAARDIEAHVCFHSQLDQIGSFRGGLAGAVVRRVALPVVLRNLPEGDRQAGQEIRTQVVNGFQEESDRYLPVVNRVAELAGKGVALLRQGKLLEQDELPVQLATTEESLLVGIGPGNQPLPPLPREPEDVPVELWVRRPTLEKDQQVAKKLFETVKKHWEDIRPAVLARLARSSPELADVLGNVSAEFVGKEWVVVRFGRGLFKALPGGAAGGAP